ncbi:MAG: hypothetical protein PQ612_01950 [Rickettsiales bacterium]|nr:hypothetical protein [Pseudomonadota bacterium]MDA0967111.1 hypothetical protein [Pseudomonadota bacterium]MDG4544907.1 hypothetical protein [Rickettsiales bacterium]
MNHVNNLVRNVGYNWFWDILRLSVYIMNYDKNKFSECISNIIKNIHYSSHYPSFYDIIIKNETGNKNESNSFVYYLLSEVFHKDNKQISNELKIFSKTDRIILKNYTKDVAETKILFANESAFESGITLNISLRRGESNAIKKP